MKEEILEPCLRCGEMDYLSRYEYCEHCHDDMFSRVIEPVTSAKGVFANEQFTIINFKNRFIQT